MIYESLSCLVDEMNEHFRSRLKVNEQKVVLSSLVNQDGTVAIQGENKLVVTLINIEKEPVRGFSQKGGGIITNSSPPVNVNLNILFSAFFSQGNYPEALRFISFIIGYFVQKPVFTHANTPALDTRIDKLSFEMLDLNTDTLSNLWSSLGAKYMPSVVYKMRMLTFDDTFVREFRPEISSVADQKELVKK